MVFKAKVFSGNSGLANASEKSVILVMNSQDASKLKKLSEENLGKRMLIACRGKVIAAPLIKEPLTSNQLVFTVKDSRVLDNLRTK